MKVFDNFSVKNLLPIFSKIICPFTEKAQVYYFFQRIGHQDKLLFEKCVSESIWIPYSNIPKVFWEQMSTLNSNLTQELFSNRIKCQMLLETYKPIFESVKNTSDYMEILKFILAYRGEFQLSIADRREALLRFSHGNGIVKIRTFFADVNALCYY